MLDRPSRHMFEDRYGAGALARLIALLEKPCVSFAAIATEFGVTRERVRQWHQELMPGAPLGHARRRLCQDYQRKRRLLTDPLFRKFHIDVRHQLGEGRLTLIRSAEGYRRRRARVDGRLVALGDASNMTAGKWRDADFVYLRLPNDAFLFAPSEVLASDGQWAPFLNTFEALIRKP